MLSTSLNYRCLFKNINSMMKHSEWRNIFVNSDRQTNSLIYKKLCRFYFILPLPLKYNIITVIVCLLYCWVKKVMNSMKLYILEISPSPHVLRPPESIKQVLRSWNACLCVCPSVCLWLRCLRNGWFIEPKISLGHRRPRKRLMKIL